MLADQGFVVDDEDASRHRGSFRGEPWSRSIRAWRQSSSGPAPLALAGPRFLGHGGRLGRRATCVTSVAQDRERQGLADRGELHGQPDRARASARGGRRP